MSIILKLICKCFGGIYVSNSDLEEICSALECVKSDRCGSIEEREKVDEVIGRLL